MSSRNIILGLVCSLGLLVTCATIGHLDTGEQVVNEWIADKILTSDGVRTKLYLDGEFIAALTGTYSYEPIQ